MTDHGTRKTVQVQPETHYAKSGTVNIAYQVVGEGPPDLVAVDVISHIELDWEIPFKARFFTRLASICRLLRINQRGIGMSDRDMGVPTLEMRMDDIRAVLDAVGSERAVLFGLGDAAPLSVLFAATYPERTSGLILMNSSPRFVKSPSLPWLPTRDETQRRADEVERRWGEAGFADAFIGVINPGASEEERRSTARVFRLSVSPGAAAAYIRMNIDVDVCDLLPLIRVPTLVMHRKEGGNWDVRSGRYLADHIPSARWVELPGADFLPALGDQETLFAALESFLADVVAGRQAEIEPDRVLATVLFSDIVGSSEKAASLGTGAGGSSCSDTTSSYVVSSSVSADRSWTPRVMASSPPSTALRGRFAVAPRSQKPCRSSGWRCGSACTRASANSSTARWPASPCTRGLASPPTPSRVRCSSPQP